jgi:transportin-3
VLTHFRDSYTSCGSEMSIEAERNRRMQIFRPPFEVLVSLVCLREEGGAFVIYVNFL